MSALAGAAAALAPTLDQPSARTLVKRRHSSGAYVAARYRFGLFEGPELAGVAVLSIPAWAEVLSGPFPDLQRNPVMRTILPSRWPPRRRPSRHCWRWSGRAGQQAVPAQVRGVLRWADPTDDIALAQPEDDMCAPESGWR